MIVEAASEYPRPLTPNKLQQIADVVRKSKIVIREERCFDETGRFLLSDQWHTEFPMWSSIVMRWDPHNYSLRCFEGWIRVYKGNGLSTPVVQTIDPGNLRYVSEWFPNHSVVEEGGLVKAPITGVSSYDDLCKLSREEILEEVEKGSKSKFYAYAKAFLLMRVCDTGLINRELYWMQFAKLSENFQAMDGVLIDYKSERGKPKLVKKSILYPFLDEESYTTAVKGMVPVSYKVVNPQEYFSAFLTGKTSA